MSSPAESSEKAFAPCDGAPKLVCSSSTSNPFAGISVLSGTGYLRRFVAESLRYQPPMLMGAPVVFFSSIQSPAPVEWVSTSFTTTACCGGATVSSIPGVPRAAVEGCHDPALLHVPTAALGSLITSESPFPSVEGYHPSEYVNSWIRTPRLSSRRMSSPLLSNESRYSPATGMVLPYRAWNAARFFTTTVFSPGASVRLPKVKSIPALNLYPVRLSADVPVFCSSTNSFSSPFTSALPGGLYISSVTRSGAGGAVATCCTPSKVIPKTRSELAVPF